MDSREPRIASYQADPAKVGRVLLLYSGGLDTSVMLHWIQETYEAEIVTLTVNLGQPGEDYDVVTGKAKELGAIEAIVVDAREEFAEDYVLPAIRANALYGGGYPLFTALGRPLIAKHGVEHARRTGCDTIAHGCTGKGNDQVRLEATVATLDPELKVIAPVREWKMGREQEIAYARAHGIPVKGGTEQAPYSIDDNLWGRSSEGGTIEDLDQPPADDVFQARHPSRGGARRAAIAAGWLRGGTSSVAGRGAAGAGRARWSVAPTSVANTALASSITSRTASSGSRSATSTKHPPRQSCSPRIVSSRSSSRPSTRTTSRGHWKATGPTSATRGSGTSRCAKISTPSCSRRTVS